MTRLPSRQPCTRCSRLAIAFGLCLAAGSLASQAQAADAAPADPVFSVLGTLKLDDPGTLGRTMAAPGMIMNTYHFGLNSLAPSYSATLTNTGLFGADRIGMALLSPSMKLMGSQVGPGTFHFSTNELGTYTLVVAGKPSAPANFDVFAAQVTPVPEAGRTAMLLTGLGLISLQLRRRGRTGVKQINADSAGTLAHGAATWAFARADRAGHYVDGQG